MSSKLIEVNGLTKVFRVGSLFSRVRLTAVDNVSFDIKDADIYTLAGESGSGKTTVSRIILGLLEASEGEILYKGKNIMNIKSEREKKEFRKDVQAIFQNPFETFNPRTVENYLYETQKNFLGVDASDSIDGIEQALTAVGLTLDDVKEKYPSEFSGGQLQRISIARALITQPSLLIADEPVSMVDASLRMSIVNLFKELKDRYGLSVLYITHDLATAYYVSDKIAIMFRGNIVEKGSVEKVLDSPKHPYTKMLKESIAQPDPRDKWDSRVDLHLTEREEYMLKGCKFAGRCPHVMERCRTEEIPDFDIDGVTVKCLLYQ